MNGKQFEHTIDNIIRSLRDKVSPCFILILFLSKDFSAYLEKIKKNISLKNYGKGNILNLLLTKFPKIL